MPDYPASPAAGDRLAKVIARSGLCSRRDAEGWIKDGRVTVNGRKVLTPAFNVSEGDRVKVDGEPLAARQGTRVWLYHKPPGLVVTEKDPEGRETIFDQLGEMGLPRVVSIGRLDINTEGLLLLTNDGGLKRVLELPATGWLRRYRVRAFGAITQEQLDALRDGIEIDGIQYGPVEATLEREQGANVWLVLALREGKNREVKNVLGALGLQVNRLIRISFGPFQLGDLAPGAVDTVPARILREQLGRRLAAEANTDFDSEMPDVDVTRAKPLNPNFRAAAPGKALGKDTPRRDVASRFRFEDDRPRREADDEPRQRRDRPGGRDQGRGPRPARPPREEAPAETRRVFFDDGTEGQVKVRTPRPERFTDERRGAKPFGKRVRRDGDEHGERDGASRGFRDGKRAAGDAPSRDKRGPRPDWAERPKRGTGDARPEGRFGAREDRPKREFGDRPQRGPRPDGAAPKRGFGGKPGGFGGKPAGDRPGRQYQGKPGGRPQAGKADSGRPEGGKRFGATRTGPGGGNAPGGHKGGGRPAGGKPFAGKPSAGKPGGRPQGRGGPGNKPAGRGPKSRG